MIEQAEKTMPVAVWVTSIKGATQPYFYNGFICEKSAVVRASSSDRKFTLELTTNALSHEHLQKFEWLLRYGFTVVDVPDFWVNDHSRPYNWQDQVIHSALNQVVERRSHDQEGVAAYDAELANAVLTILNESFPYSVSMIEVKRSLGDEPNDDVLMTALDALLFEGKIDGQFKRGSARNLVATAEIKITPHGRKEITGAHHSAVVYGDQNINYGNAGAIGRQSVGTINYQQQWTAVANQVDLSQVATELQVLRTELMKTAKVFTDFEQLALIAKAEQYAQKQDGTKVMEVLSRAGKGLLDFAKGVGTDITAKVIAKAIGLEP